MGEDAEINAMSVIAGALAGLDDGAKSRVLKWAADRFKADVMPARDPPGSAGPTLEHADFVSQFGDAPGLYHAADPQTESDKALVIGYWLQQVREQPKWTAFEVNRELKQMGYMLGNVTDALTSLMSRRPALAIQVEKSGKSRQSRKKYQLTYAGLQAVERMVEEKRPG